MGFVYQHFTTAAAKCNFFVRRATDGGASTGFANAVRMVGTAFKSMQTATNVLGGVTSDTYNSIAEGDAR
jgi:hypothetical protein